ncbi:MAG: SdpI family protein [Gemmatimonadales bacterium]
MRSRWLGMVILGATIGLSIWAYPDLPARVATHWNIHGVPDRYSSKQGAVVIIPLIIAVLLALVQILPKIDPKGKNYSKFFGTYWVLVNCILLFLAGVHGVVLGYGIGIPVDIARAMPIGLGLLLALIGNYLTRVQPNWFIGIRTPWTLSSEDVWRRTHRTGGWVFVGGGATVAALGLVPRLAKVPVILATIVVVALIPVVQSYVLWRKEHDSEG